MNCLKPYIWKPLCLYNKPRFIAPLTTLSNNINNIESTDIIHKVNLTIGTIIEAEPHPEAEHLYIEKVDIGEEEPRTIVSGLAKFIPIQELKNKKVIVVKNLKASRFRGVLSQGMLLAASNKDQTAVDLLTVPENSINGERLKIGNNEMEMQTPDPVLKPKQKIFEQVAEHLLTNDDGIATYKGLPLVASTGLVLSKIIKNGQIS
ncbi:unnamed protein product [Cunninghamella blakesleeana]